VSESPLNFASVNRLPYASSAAGMTTHGSVAWARMMNGGSSLTPAAALPIDGHQDCDTLGAFFLGFLHRWPSEAAIDDHQDCDTLGAFFPGVFA
jgi:hypothetical protein